MSSCWAQYEPSQQWNQREHCSHQKKTTKKQTAANNKQQTILKKAEGADV